MMGKLKWMIRAVLARAGYDLVRRQNLAPTGSLSLPPIGHDVCLKGLVSRGYQPAAVMDIGAAYGAWTRMALQYWPASHYLLIEPLQEHREHLTELSKSAANVAALTAAVGAQSGELEFGVQSTLDGSSFLYPGQEQRLVPVVTLDSLVESGQFPPPQVLKLDVQGYELKALSGAVQTLRTCDLVIVELQFYRFAPEMSLIHEVMAWMTANGFRPYEVVDVLRRPFDNAMGQCDLMFAREDHWLVSSNRWG
jgi:FkbM family methyltransferase